MISGEWATQFPVELEVGASGDLISFVGSHFEGKEHGGSVPGPRLEIISKPEVILRFENPGLISRDAPVPGGPNIPLTLRENPGLKAADGRMGALNFKANQEPALS